MRGLDRLHVIGTGAVAALAMLAQACAAQTPSSLGADIALGHDLAAARCAGCHAVEAQGASPNRRAPPFRALSGRYVELTLHRQLTEIAETGHSDMPPVPVHTEEVRAIAAYLNSLPPTDGARP